MVLNQWVWKIFAVASPIRVFQNSPTFWGICSLALIYQGYSSHTCFFSHGDDSKKPEFTQIPFKNPYQAKHLNISHCTAKFPTQPRRVWFRQVPPNNDGFYVRHKGGQLYRPYRLRCRMSNRGNGFRQAACVVFCVATYWISCGGCFCWKIFLGDIFCLDILGEDDPNSILRPVHMFDIVLLGFLNWVSHSITAYSFFLGGWQEKNHWFGIWNLASCANINYWNPRFPTDFV